MIVRLIVENHKMEEQEAINAFYNSKIAEKLADKNLKLYLLSPYIIYEIWDTEFKNGDMKKSPYYLIY